MCHEPAYAGDRSNGEKSAARIRELRPCDTRPPGSRRGLYAFARIRELQIEAEVGPYAACPRSFELVLKYLYPVGRHPDHALVSDIQPDDAEDQGFQFETTGIKFHEGCRSEKLYGLDGGFQQVVFGERCTER